jgi:hypothetical protein
MSVTAAAAAAAAAAVSEAESAPEDEDEEDDDAAPVAPDRVEAKTNGATLSVATPVAACVSSGVSKPAGTNRFSKVSSMASSGLADTASG